MHPAPRANAGNDVTTCLGNNLTLHGSGGTAYNWSPPDYLSNAGIVNPTVVLPPTGIYTYLLNVTDANGCKSVKPDTVNVNILPAVRVFAGNDTSIAANQPLQLNATDVFNSGFNSYSWVPSNGLSNPLIKNPVAVLTNDITYTVIARTPDNCISQDEISIRVFKEADIYVPMAFTPNGDGTNDIFKPILVGIMQLNYFAVYNRYGELVFKTSEQGKGWDGLYKGKSQHTGAFVWVAEAIDYKGNIVLKKGTVALIR